MEIREASKRLQALMKAILDVWERSVGATNLFHADSEIKRTKECALGVGGHRAPGRR